ncbi:MAG: cation:proton antiporter, partial [Oscillospiraceae bacterium]|nr:cation:proton antiporter [Oscillospiraceae bacterium]
SLMAGTVHAERVEHLSGGVKDLFGSIFFLSVGMLIDPAMIVRYIVPILILTAVTIAGKLLISSLGVLLSGQSLHKAIRCGCSLAQIGEFAFIIASLGMSLGVIADYIYPIVVAVSVLTTLTTPFFIKSSEQIYRGVDRLLPKRLSEKLDRYTEEDAAGREQDSDWGRFLRRYVLVTAIYGVLMMGVTLLGQFVLYPFLEKTPLDQRLVRLACVAFCVVGIALFVRPMLDLRSTEYTTLWVKDRHYRLPLISLTALRYLLIVLIAFFPLQTLLGVSGVWLLPLIAAAVFLISRSGWLASAYITAEARFMANFNERQLQRDQTDAEWLDEKLFVDELDCTGEIPGKTLRQLDWGQRFRVNAIRVLRGKKHLNMPTGNVELKEGDKILLIGRREDLRALRLSLGLSDESGAPTLRAFTESQEGDAAHLYATVIPVAQAPEIQGKSIRSSGLREKYDCMILGLQRDKLPILQPDVNMTIQPDDLIWVLGTRKMAAKLLAGGFSEE